MNSIAEVREPELPYGWYPSSAAKIREFLDTCAKESTYKGELPWRLSRLTLAGIFPDI